MKYCKCKFSYVFDHECDTATVPCPNSERSQKVAILKESTPSEPVIENDREYHIGTNIPWKITDREKVWTNCYNWLSKQPNIGIVEVSARYNVCRFIKKTKEHEVFKLYLPYADTNLQTVVLNELSGEWIQVKTIEGMQSLIDGESTPSETESQEIEMRTDCDCMVACLAMLMGWTYEQAAEFFPPKAITETGYRWEMLVPYLSANRIRLVWHGSDAITSVDWSRPAMVDVPSLTAPDKGDHIIFWDGQKVIDPSRRKDVKYTALPNEIFNVYQLKP